MMRTAGCHLHVVRASLQYTACMMLMAGMCLPCSPLPQVSYKPGVFIVKSKGGATFEADLSEG